MLVFKTPMSGFITVGCNQITTLRLVVNSSFFGNHRLPPENHKNILSKTYSPFPRLQIGTSFDVPNRQVIY